MNVVFTEFLHQKIGEMENCDSSVELKDENGLCRFHAHRKSVGCFSYEPGDNFQVEMVEVQLEMSFCEGEI